MVRRDENTAVPRWNHNIHYHRVVLDAVPPSARTALDVGTGDGLLAADLRSRVPSVTGIDTDADVLRRASAEVADVEWVHGDVLTHPFAPASFDVVASVATVHHLPDLRETFRRFAELAAPSGVVVVVGLARSAGVADAMYEVAGVVQHRYHSRRRHLWEHTAPTVWPPPHTYAEVKRAAADVLPGMRWRRLAMWRYAVEWTKDPSA
ncbi:class I SAM-dependent methyltransferase [Sanguibacter suaedae]|uniref:Class I SAM-dependent methyltransferase n=1 Tax=Sanguibacter suaedae TaxID=2795737 RepID=A0A934IBE1_9MICO|nr:class I SAM-dependent methyltransferase [Sanguibacter suaedae]MBI9113784.1 class I SAM-dependent methyltransferase [Sanguibacter suaedae]